MNVWLATECWDYESELYLGVFADPADAMIYLDEHYELDFSKKRWMWSTGDEHFVLSTAGTELHVQPVEFHRFVCEAFIMSGPGHQSKHTCQSGWPHDIEDEHEDDLNIWSGTWPNTSNEWYRG